MHMLDESNMRLWTELEHLQATSSLQSVIYTNIDNNILMSDTQSVSFLYSMMCCCTKLSRSLNFSGVKLGRSFKSCHQHAAALPIRFIPSCHLWHTVKRWHGLQHGNRVKMECLFNQGISNATTPRKSNRLASWKRNWSYYCLGGCKSKVLRSGLVSWLDWFWCFLEYIALASIGLTILSSSCFSRILLRN